MSYQRCHQRLLYMDWRSSVQIYSTTRLPTPAKCNCDQLYCKFCRHVIPNTSGEIIQLKINEQVYMTHEFCEIRFIMTSICIQVYKA